MRTAAELGIEVPDDLSVVGFDNIPESALTDPPLTTVDQSIQALGHEAVRMLVELIEHPERHDDADPIHITLPTKLVVRRSTRATEARRASTRHRRPIETFTTPVPRQSSTTTTDPAPTEPTPINTTEGEAP